MYFGTIYSQYIFQGHLKVQRSNHTESLFAWSQDVPSGTRLAT